MSTCWRFAFLGYAVAAGCQSESGGAATGDGTGHADTGHADTGHDGPASSTLGGSGQGSASSTGGGGVATRGPMASTSTTMVDSTTGPDTTSGGNTTTTSGGSTTSFDTDADTDADTDTDTTTGGDSRCCDGYPVGMGCDEDDDGVVNDESEGGNSGGAEDTGFGKGDDFPLLTSIYDMQLGLVEVGELVAINHVVVTSPTAPDRDGFGIMFTIAEPMGGQYSGITVRTWSTPVTDALQPGDVISLEGEHRLRYIFSLVGVSPNDITRHGTGAMPEPIVVPAEDIEQISAGGELAKPLESVVVRVENPVVVDPRPCDGEVEVQADLRIDDRFLLAAGEDLPVPDAGYAAVAGPLLYTFNGFEVAPRTSADIEE